jgi:hypothetical protein
LRRARRSTQEGEELIGEMNGHSGSVSCMAVMGSHVWSGSADHNLVVWNVSTRIQLLTIPNQGGGYARCCARVGWALWVFSSNGVKVWAAQSVADGADTQRLALEADFRDQLQVGVTRRATVRCAELRTGREVGSGSSCG